ncbi:hypothetical protein D3C78_1845430 [compost metagenome]
MVVRENLDIAAPAQSTANVRFATEVFDEGISQDGEPVDTLDVVEQFQCGAMGHRVPFQA